MYSSNAVAPNAPPGGGNGGDRPEGPEEGGEEQHPAEARVQRHHPEGGPQLSQVRRCGVEGRRHPREPYM